MGNSAYYRIPTQYGIASLPMAICQIFVAVFSIAFVCVATSLFGSSAVAVVVLLVASAVGMMIAAELRGETSTVERGAVSIGVMLIIVFIFANVFSPMLPMVSSEIEVFGLRFAIVELASLAVVLVVAFFEAGYIAAKFKRFYLVDPKSGEILLAEYSGDRFFFGYLDKVKYEDNERAPIGYLSGGCSFGGRKDGAEQYVWCEFRRVVMKRENVRLTEMPRRMDEKTAAEGAETNEGTR